MSAPRQSAKAAPARKGTRPLPPQVNKVGINDLIDVLALGLRDFRAAPTYDLFFAGIYAVGGWVLVLMLMAFELPYLVYPLAAGFALIAPFIASGFYVVSQRLETPPEDGSSPLSWGIVLGTVKSMFSHELGWMALVTGFSLFFWMDIAALLSFGFMGFQFFGFRELINEIFTTPTGWLFLVVGNTAGAAIAAVAPKKPDPVTGEERFRLILDARYLNEYVQRFVFEMETLGSRRHKLRPGDWMTSIDLKSGYWHLGIHPEHHKYFGFSHQLPSREKKAFWTSGALSAAKITTAASSMSRRLGPQSGTR